MMTGKLLKRICFLGHYESEIGRVLDAASELHYYVRKMNDKVCANTFVDDIKCVLAYYEKYKYVDPR